MNMIIGLYEVRMKHDDGVKCIRINASGIDAAMRLVCEIERAPVRSVEDVKLLKKIA